MAGTLGGLGHAARAGGDYVSASRYLTEAGQLFDAAGQRWTVALCLADLNHIAEAQEDFAWSARLLGAAAAFREKYHFPLPPAEREGQQERLTALRALLGNSAFDSACLGRRAGTVVESGN